MVCLDTYLHSKKNQKRTSFLSGNRPITIKDQKHFLEEMALIPATSVSVIYYSQPSCGPCKQIAPIFIQLCQKYQDVKFIRVDIEKCPEIGESHKVTTIPSFILCRNHTILDRVHGTNMNNLENKIKQYVQMPAQTD